MTNRVFGKDGEWYAVVNGKVVGPWPLRPYAVAGMQTEIRLQSRRGELIADQWAELAKNLA